FRTACFNFLPTYDIDIAYSYLHKGTLRNLGGFIRSMWGSEWPLVKERMNVLFGKEKDPFDSYLWLDEFHNENNLKPIYFFLLADKNKDYDKNILPHKRAMQQLVKQHSERYEIGIHPSWQSGDDAVLLKQEIEKLKNLAARPVIKSRQHYIRLTLPETYRRLIDIGVTEDYSMGYGSINGFRASYCLPYLWYDVQKEEKTNLTIFPFCYMDANSYYEQHYNCEKALEEMVYYYNATKQVNGLLITIWHNHFLGTDKMFRGWTESYRAMIARVAKD
ncbi:MAG: polysaccharide deacetylase family protein, partial [Bacteroidota bacterium]|nr:polysaccharide deacetylase family protein [Bacteroidota bacterium]